MLDNAKVLDAVPRNSLLAQLGNRPPKEAAAEKPDEEEDSCLAFGYLRGVRDRALALELRFRDGTSAWFPYNWLGPFFYHPSVGLLMKFTGDTVTLVLIRGSNLDAPVRQGSMTLMDRGLQRHRVTYVREMDESELRKAGEAEPTIDRIEVVECESSEEQQAWLAKHAPAFQRAP
jgi:hypothetical protein